MVVRGSADRTKRRGLRKGQMGSRTLTEERGSGVGRGPPCAAPAGTDVRVLLRLSVSTLPAVCLHDAQPRTRPYSPDGARGSMEGCTPRGRREGSMFSPHEGTSDLNRSRTTPTTEPETVTGKFSGEAAPVGH